MRKLKPMEQMLTHLLRVGKCRYYTGSMTTYFTAAYIRGNVNWLDHLFLNGMIETAAGPFDPKHPSGNIWTNMPKPGDEIWLTTKGKEKAKRLAKVEKR